MITKMPFQYFYTIDDVILALEDITKNGYTSIFENDFFSMLKEVHDQHGLNVNLSLFYKTSPAYLLNDDNFTLNDVTAEYKAEFEENSDWLKMSFHAWEYETQYNQQIRNIYEDYLIVEEQAKRFAGEQSWYGNYNCTHFYNGTRRQLKELAKNIGTVFQVSRPRQLMPSSTSYLSTRETLDIYEKDILKVLSTNVWHIARTGVIERLLGVNNTNETYPNVKSFLDTVKYKRFIDMGTHEVYFTLDHGAYNPNVIQGFYDMGEWMKDNGYEPGFPNKDLFDWNWV